MSLSPARPSPPSSQESRNPSMRLPLVRSWSRHNWNRYTFHLAFGGGLPQYYPNSKDIEPSLRNHRWRCLAIPFDPWTSTRHQRYWHRDLDNVVVTFLQKQFSIVNDLWQSDEHESFFGRSPVASAISWLIHWTVEKLYVCVEIRSKETWCGIPEPTCPRQASLSVKRHRPTWKPTSHDMNDCQI
jgi:hypothetical protein